MGLIFHAPYLLRGVLLSLAAGLPLAIWAAVRWRAPWQIRWLILLFAGLALAACGGTALTSTVPNAHTADVAGGVGLALMAAGAAAVSWGALGLRAGRPAEQDSPPPAVDGTIWPPSPKA